VPDFLSPSHRGTQSDLAISISPLGLVELADEEFEVHGPRLSRYATNWAMYLGHHWAYKRSTGEPQLTFNFVRAFSDYINAFCFGRGVRFHTPRATEAIVPNLLHRVWDIDNKKDRILWAMGQVGGVSGDVFVKIAYEDPYVDPAGRLHPGRVRIIVLNPSFCMPEFHPHDKTRIIRFKLKYRFWTTAGDGTRQVRTFTEITTDQSIEEYIDDQPLEGSPRPNVLGTIPVIHIPNFPIEGSPWGLSDVDPIIPLNREFNEKATEISDVINYHAQPVTVITGGKASNLEKGPNKVWGGLPKDAKVFNLDMTANFSGPLAYLEMLKASMHELTGVPHGALGEKQAISNTAGVALAIQYQSLMNRALVKHSQYGFGIERINELILLTMAVREPHMMVFDPGKESDLKPGQYPILDPHDPLTYETTTDFPPPLPTDVLIKLNEIQGKMELGLESKRGAMRELGEEFPDEKMAEVFEELREDILEQGAIDYLRGMIQVANMAALGIVPGEEEGDVVPAGGPGVSHASGQSSQMAVPYGLPDMVSHLVTTAHGTKMAQRRKPRKSETS
jgi:hypothetical protein